MRTTLTIDDELVKELKDLAQQQGLTFKATVNQVLAVGLRAMCKPPLARRYKATTYAMGQPRVPSLDAALRLAADLEAEEVARKLARPK